MQPVEQTRTELGDFTADRRILLISALALVVGTGGVVAAWALLRLIALCTNFAYYGDISLLTRPIQGHHLGLWAVAVPVVGGLIIGLMARYGSDKIRGHGIPEAIEAILMGESRISLKVALLKPLSSAISIGSGGPFGAEGPIIMTGGAIGSLLGQVVHLTAAERKTLLVAGSAAGMTAIFGTPMAAILLAVELLLFEWKPRSLLPVAVAALTAAVERGPLMGTGPLFPFATDIVVSSQHVLIWAAIGFAAGLGSGVLTFLVYATEDGFEKFKFHWMWWPAIGGLVVGLGGLIEPAALGVGYDNISALLTGDMTLRAILILLAVKAVIWAVALGSGTSGGVLAPLLILGGALGAAGAHLFGADNPGLWSLLGMAAMMGGTMRSPLTAILFAIELTGEHRVLVPLLAACFTSYGTTVLLLKRSILTEKLARRGQHLTREYHADPFDLMRVREVMVTKVDTLADHMTAAETVAFFSSSDERRHKSYPVVNSLGQLAGMVSRADIMAWLVHRHDNSAALAEITTKQAVVTGFPDELVGHLADRMVAAGVGRIPVVAPDSGQLLGIVTRKDILKVRARRLREENIRSGRIARQSPKADAIRRAAYPDQS